MVRWDTLGIPQKGWRPADYEHGITIAVKIK